jgi:hypothetical protein
MDCKNASIVVAIFCSCMSVYCGVRSFRVWRDPEGTFAYFLGGGYDERGAHDQVFLSKIIGPFLTLVSGVAAVANLFNFFKCRASPQLLASVAILYGPLQVISFQAILAVSLVIGAITYVLNKQVRGGARFAYAAYLAAFSFAGLQTAAFSRWGDGGAMGLCHGSACCRCRAVQIRLAKVWRTPGRDRIEFRLDLVHSFASW